MFYHIIHNRSGEIASSEDLLHAGMIVDALMMGRASVEPIGNDGKPWHSYWVRDDEGNEYYWHRAERQVFSSACGEGDD